MAAPPGQYACGALICTETAVLRFVPESWLWGHVTVTHGRQLRALPCTSCQALMPMLVPRLQLEPRVAHNGLGPFQRHCWPSCSCAKARGVAWLVGGAGLPSKAEGTGCWHAPCLDMGFSAPVLSHLCSRNRNWERSTPRTSSDCRPHLRGPGCIWPSEKGAGEHVPAL